VVDELSSPALCIQAVASTLALDEAATELRVNKFIPQTPVGFFPHTAVEKSAQPAGS